MKNIFTLMIGMLLCVPVFAQTPSVTITGNTVYVEPNSEISYQAVPNNFPSGAHSYSCTWEITGTTQTVSYVDQVNAPAMIKYIAKVKWDNTPNTLSKSIKAKVKYKTGSGSTLKEFTVDSNVYGVTVRHLGAVISMTIAGTTYTSGQTRNQPCGAQSLAISVPTPVTDPVVAVTYYWTYPSGWSGPASSTSPSVTVTTSPGTQGTIKVEAKRNDGILRTSLSINITRPLPVINTVTVNDATLCTTTQTLSAGATGTNADKFSWTPASGIKINGQTTAQTVAGNVSISATATGNYTVRAYSTVCAAASANSIIKTIYFGAPPTPTGTVNGQSQQTPNIVPNGAYLVLNSPPGQYSYNWSILQGTGYLYPGGGNSANATPNPFIRVEGKVTNVCGSALTIFYLSNGSMGFSLSPNPVTKNEIRVRFESTEFANEMVQDIKIYDQNQRALKNLHFTSGQGVLSGDSKELAIDLTGIKPGQYYMHVTIGGKVEKKMFVVN